MSFRRRTYPEVLDNLLTGLVGGVSAESHPYPTFAPTEPVRNALADPPVTSIVSVFGARNGEPFLFVAETDYRLGADQQSLEWQPTGRRPDPGTLFHVNYMAASNSANLNDVHVGSVARSIVESVGLEISRLYAELKMVYESAFVDLATDRSLDNVVSLLGVERVRAGRFSGDIEITRVPGSRGQITLTAGTRVLTEDGNVEYETTAAVTMLDGQNTVRVTARDAEKNAEGLPADALIVLAKPIAGIQSVTNPAPTTLGDQDESDADLRSRARSFLNGSERATLGAIKHAIARQQIMADVDEPADRPGEIDITFHADAIAPELRQRVEAAIRDVRPAGIRINYPSTLPPQRINVELRITSGDGLLEQDLRGAQDKTREAISDYFARLPVKAAGSINKLINLVLNSDGIDDARIVSATRASDSSSVLDREAGTLAIEGVPTVLGELRIVDTNLPTLLRVIVSFPEDQPPPDAATIGPALSGTLAHLNNLNASEPAAGATLAELAKREASYARLLYALPLPTAEQPRGTLQQLDEPAPGATPAPLPTADSITPYTVEFVVTSASGVARIMTSETDLVHTLTPFERLSLANVEINRVSLDA